MRAEYSVTCPDQTVREPAPLNDIRTFLNGKLPDSEIERFVTILQRRGFVDHPSGYSARWEQDRT